MLGPPTVAKLTVLGLVFYTLTQGAQIVAIDSQPAATTSLLLSMTPLAVAAVSSRTLKERINRQQLIGVVVAACGALLYSSGQLGATIIGMTAAAIALVSNVAGGLPGAGLVLEGWPSVTWRAAAIIAWLAVVNTAFAFTLWNLSMRRLSALESAAINNALLVQIAVLAWVFLDEAPGWFGLAGIVLVSAGVLQIQLASKPRAPVG
ncbi:MAG: DMT family transporter [Actinobacteria bacterium]|nr:DMT family transporter [Actinomycetota bacterium]